MKEDKEDSILDNKDKRPASESTTSADVALGGYEFVSLGKMTDMIKKGIEPNEAYEKAKGTYGRFNDAAKYIDPRKE